MTLEVFKYRYNRFIKPNLNVILCKICYILLAIFSYLIVNLSIMMTSCWIGHYNLCFRISEMIFGFVCGSIYIYSLVIVFSTPYDFFFKHDLELIKFDFIDIFRFGSMINEIFEPILYVSVVSVWNNKLMFDYDITNPNTDLMAIMPLVPVIDNVDNVDIYELNGDIMLGKQNVIVYYNYEYYFGYINNFYKLFGH